MSYSKKSLWLRIAITSLGLVITGFGISLFIFSNLGLDPASVFQSGVAHLLGVQYGTGSAVTNALILMIVFLIDRKYVNIASFLAIFLIGYTADFGSYVLHSFFSEGLPLFAQYLMMILGCFVIGFGVAVYIKPGLGVGAIDLVAELISDKTGVSYRTVRICGDITYVVLGYFLGGTLGIATVFAVLIVGPSVQFSRRYIDRWYGTELDVKKTAE